LLISNPYDCSLSFTSFSLTNITHGPNKYNHCEITIIANPSQALLLLQIKASIVVEIQTGVAMEI